MAGEGVLSLHRTARAALAAGALLGMFWPRFAIASDDPADRLLRRAERLTVSVADDLLGQLSADGKTLYFVSNRNTTNQIFAQNIEDGRAKQLFDDDADVTWPRISPDGRLLLYISYRDQASGRLCVRALPEGGGRRCLDDAVVGLQAEWTDNHNIALVGRTSIEGELSVLDVRVGASLHSSPIFVRSLTSPTVSPDGRWLVYVPVARTTPSVGPAFAAHAAPALSVARLSSSDPPMAITVDLPGQTGQPVFARDGRSLYFVQFFVDSNHDGVVDASDHGVVFRVPISFPSDRPVLGAPEQLTETSANCEYPAPFKDRLIITCSEDESLDIYSLPLDGEVPAEWTAEALGAVEAEASSRAEEQLLVSRRLSRETTVLGRQRAMLSLALVHLEAEEFRAAEFYAHRLDASGDDAIRGVAKPLETLVVQRRASRRRDQGRMMEGFSAEAKKRLAALHAESAGSAMATMLTHLVKSEIADSIGDKTLARSELEAVVVDDTTPSPLIHAYYLTADALYRELDDREALFHACRALSSNRGLSPEDQLRYARAALRALVRGLSSVEARARLARPLVAPMAEEGELSFALEVTDLVVTIQDAHPPPSVVRGLTDLYARESRPGRRRALMGDAMRRAAAMGAEEVLEALATRDIQEVRRGTRERSSAERLYRRLLTGRAYLRASERRYDEASADFEAVARETGSLEAVVGAIDMHLKRGEMADAIARLYERPGAEPKVAHFAKAYLLARELPKLEGEAHAKAAAAAIQALQSSWSALKNQRIAQALFGALLHEEYLLTNDLGTAERANVHYLIALELMGQNPRFRAMILGELGILHADVGNFRIAVGYLLDRDKLPYSDNSEGLDAMLSEAQSLLHVGREGDAAALADRALGVIDRNPALARYRVLALDWAAVCHLAAGHFARALALYGEEIPLLAALPTPSADAMSMAERNRLVVRVARAAAAIGAGQPSVALADLDYVDTHLDTVGPALQWPHATREHVAETYRLIAAGLRANAYQALGLGDDEARAIETRLSILQKQREATHRSETAEAELLAWDDLALNASRRHDPALASKALTQALAIVDELRVHDLGMTGRPGLDTLRLAADLSTSMGATLEPTLTTRIASVSAELATRRDPELKAYQRWFEIYGTLLAPTAPLAPKPAP